jgi:ribosome-associated protein
MPKRTNKKKPPAETLVELVLQVLNDLKAEAIVRLDVRHLTSVTDAMIIANGRSSRHVRAVAEAVVQKCKDNGHRPLGIEGAVGAEWVLVDLADVVVHVMLPKVRDFYELEKLWDIDSFKDAEESS